jgi:hypothetical protein
MRTLPWHVPPYDLSIGKIPLAAGTSTSIERAPFDLLSPGTRVNTVGEAITPFTIGRYGGPLNVTYSATGLPPGLTLDSNTGLVTGTIPESASSGSYSVHVTATDGFNHHLRLSMDFGLGISFAAPEISFDSRRSSQPFCPSQHYGQAYSAQGLPTGLTINVKPA